MAGRALEHSLAITMWDFSWLERRWPGAGYESWERALDELVERGYDAVRIDAYPHLVAAEPGREWELLPVWNQQVWGSPARTRVRVQPALNDFIRCCADRGIWVELSSWFRQDSEDTRLQIGSPRDLARIWVRTLDSIDAAGLLDHILYVDLCNEWPLPEWSPFLARAMDVDAEADVTAYLGRLPELIHWMRDAIAAVRQHHPELDYCFSFVFGAGLERLLMSQDLSFMDLFEPHIWMAQWSEFYDEVGYRYEKFDSTGYDNLARTGESVYRSRPEHWQERLRAGVRTAAEWSRSTARPLITTECWSVVDYKDWPLLRWDWIKDLCELGVTEASQTGCWTAIATSNFCGPQFVGMWRDVDWHRRLTDVIHSGPRKPV